MNVNAGEGSWGFGTGFPIIYDHFSENLQGQKLLDTALFQNPSTELAGQLQSNQLFLTDPMREPVMEIVQFKYTHPLDGSRDRVIRI